MISIGHTSSNHWFSGDMRLFRAVTCMLSHTWSEKLAFTKNTWKWPTFLRGDAELGRRHHLRGNPHWNFSCSPSKWPKWLLNGGDPNRLLARIILPSNYHSIRHFPFHPWKIREGVLFLHRVRDGLAFVLFTATLAFHIDLLVLGA